MKILLVEDEPKSAAYVRKGLRESGYLVDVAADGDEAVSLAASLPYDLLILDILLPRRSGFAVLGDLRSQGISTPVLFLSAKGEVGDRVKGLELGADDYLVKPFSFSELLARVRSVLRRGPGRQSEMIHIADLEIDLLRHRATRAGHNLELTPKEFTLLSLLARHQGEVLTRTLISEQVWDMNFDSDTNVVDVAVRRLRAKLDDPFKCKLIHTVRGMGYVLEAQP